MVLATETAYTKTVLQHNIIQEVLAIVGSGKSSVLANPEGDLRIETWSKKQKNGNIHRYWVWAKRGSGSVGKRGGRRLRIYGGKFTTVPSEKLSTKQRAKWTGLAPDTRSESGQVESVLA